jgi:multimeric flavodoxin WrbA
MMIKAIAINGSPRKEKGNTATVLSSFIDGLTECEVDTGLFYASKLKVLPCACGGMQCWYESPGECCNRDDMQLLYPKLKAAEILIIATPVYIPLPGDMQNVINRLCPLVEPYLEYREGRTRARFRQDVNIRKIVLVSTGGWWEKENMSSVVRIVEELAENASVEFGGAILRPHAFLMKKDGKITKEGEEILGAVRRAGKELIQEGKMSQETLDVVSRPLITEEELRQRYNQMV